MENIRINLANKMYHTASTEPLPRLREQIYFIISKKNIKLELFIILEMIPHSPYDVQLHPSSNKI